MKLTGKSFGFRLCRKHIYYEVFAACTLGALTFLLICITGQFGDESEVMIPTMLAGAGLPAALGGLLALRYGVIDLSIWAVMSLGGLVAAALINAGMAPWGAFTLAVGTGAIVGAVNGFIVWRSRLPAIVITAVVGLVLLVAMNLKYSERSVFVPNSTFDNWVSDIHGFFDAANEGIEKISPQNDKQQIVVPGSITGPLMVLRALLVFIAWSAVLLVLGIADNVAPQTFHPHKKWWIRPVCLCASGAMAALSGACWLLDVGYTPVARRLVDGLTIPVAVILTGTLLLQGRGRTMLAVIFLPMAVLCASLWKQFTYPLMTMGYSMPLVVLGIIILAAQWAYARGLDRTQKNHIFYHVSCGLALLGLAIIGFAPQLGIQHVKSVSIVGIGIASGGLGITGILVFLAYLTRKKQSGATQETPTTPTTQNTHITNSPEETHELGKLFGTKLKTGDCIALSGNLGAGKTAFVRGLADGLGCDVRLVSSPTYVLVQQYPSQDDAHITLYHLDLYRLGNPLEEFDDLGVDEMLSSGAVVIEWPDQAAPAIPRPYTQISITIDGPTTRRWTISRIDN